MTETIAVQARGAAAAARGPPDGAATKSAASRVSLDGSEDERVWLADEAMVEQALASAVAAEPEVACAPALPPRRDPDRGGSLVRLREDSLPDR